MVDGKWEMGGSHYELYIQVMAMLVRQSISPSVRPTVLVFCEKALDFDRCGECGSTFGFKRLHKN